MAQLGDLTLLSPFSRIHTYNLLKLYKTPDGASNSTGYLEVIETPIPTKRRDPYNSGEYYGEYVLHDSSTTDVWTIGNKYGLNGGAPTKVSLSSVVGASLQPTITLTLNYPDDFFVGTILSGVTINAFSYVGAIHLTSGGVGLIYWYQINDGITTTTEVALLSVINSTGSLVFSKTVLPALSTNLNDTGYIANHTTGGEYRDYTLGDGVVITQIGTTPPLVDGATISYNVDYSTTGTIYMDGDIVSTSEIYGTHTISTSTYSAATGTWGALVPPPPTLTESWNNSVPDIKIFMAGCSWWEAVSTTTGVKALGYSGGAYPNRSNLGATNTEPYQDLVNPHSGSILSYGYQYQSDTWWDNQIYPDLGYLKRTRLLPIEDSAPVYDPATTYTKGASLITAGVVYVYVSETPAKDAGAPPALGWVSRRDWVYHFFAGFHGTFNNTGAAIPENPVPAVVAYLNYAKGTAWTEVPNTTWAVGTGGNEPSAEIYGLYSKVGWSDTPSGSSIIDDPNG